MLSTRCKFRHLLHRVLNDQHGQFIIRRNAAPAPPPPPPPPVGVLFDMYQTGSYPNYAFHSSPASGSYIGIYYTISQLPNQAPSGNDAIRFNAIPTTDVVGDIGSADWSRVADQFGPFTQGDRVYVRWRQRFVAPLAWKRAEDEGRGQWKSMIFGDPCESVPYQPTRVIAFDRRGSEAPLNQPQTFIVQNIGCAPPIDCATSPRPIPVVGVWNSIQYEIQSSSTPTANDAVLKLWFNNNNFGSPTAVSVDGFPLKVTGWSAFNDCDSAGFRWGPGTFEPINEDASLICDWADFQIASSFDSNWYI